MAATTVTLNAYLKTDFTEALVLNDSDGAPFDLTNYQASGPTCEVRDRAGGNLLATATLTVTSATDGEVDIDLTDTQIDAIGEGTRKLDVKIIRDSDSKIYRSELVTLVVSEVATE